MNCKSKKLLTVILTVAMSICLLFAMGVTAVSADEVQEPAQTSYSFTMNESAQAKLLYGDLAVDGVDNAIRFVSQINKSAIDSNIEEHDVKVKTIIVKASDVAVEDLTKKYLDENEIKYQQVIFSEGVNLTANAQGDNYVFQACLYNVKDVNYTADLCAVSYLEIDGEIVEYTNVATANLWDVANTAKQALVEEHGSVEGVLASADAVEYNFVSTLCQIYQVKVTGFDGEVATFDVKHGQTITAEQVKAELDVEGTAYFTAVEGFDFAEPVTKNVTATASMKALAFSEVEGGYEVVGYAFEDEATVINIPAKYNGENVVKVADNAFKNNTKITAVTFPAGLAIGERAFYNCDGIKELNFPKLASIGKEAFRGCDGILKVIFPDGIENNFPIGEAAFRECKNMKLLSIRNKATLTRSTDGDSIFFDCIGLEAIMVGSYFHTATAGENQIFGVTSTIQKDGYIPKATIYVDASIDTNPGQAPRVNIRGAGQTNVIPSGRIYVIGMTMNADKLGRVGGTYTIGEDGMPVGVGHAWIGRQGEDNDTANTNGVTVYYYNAQLSWYNIQELCDNYYKDGKCTVCGSSQPE